MARPPTPRPPGEHLAKLMTMLRQVEADTTLPPVVKADIKQKLSALMGAFQDIITGGEQSGLH